MTNKLQSLLAVFVTSASGFIAWLVSLPPENQDALIKPMIELTPLAWRPAIGLIMTLIAKASVVYALYKSSNSSKETPLLKP